MIVIELKGGLGNQMFQYALGRHLSIKYKSELLLDINYLLDRTPRKGFVFRNYDLSIFNISEKFASRGIYKDYGINKGEKRTILDKIIKPLRLNYIKEKGFEFNQQVLNAGDNLYLNGYWQTEKYFKDIEDIIRKDFTFKTKMGIKSDVLAGNIVNTQALCVHVRRGDFVNNPILGTIGIEYYTSAIDYIKKYISDPVVYVFSDEIDWCRENLKFKTPTYYVSNGHTSTNFRDDFELMTLCKYFIIPNSTFAWWAAWLSSYPHKIVVAPKVWFRSGNWNYEDIVPENWIRL